MNKVASLLKVKNLVKKTFSQFFVQEYGFREAVRNISLAVFLLRFKSTVYC